ncbi:MAG: MOSC N-terminal beta barrel domain-containing protein [Ilumatobacteraceae bacterium]
MKVVGRVVGLFVYPVKSLQGIAVESSAIGERGLVGDRSRALRDVATGVVLTGRRDPSLLMAAAVRTVTGAIAVRLPDGSITTNDAHLSTWLGRPIELIDAIDRASTYEINLDFEDDDSEVERWQGPVGSFHDSTRTQVSIIATGDIRDWDVRRFRPNVVVEADSIDRLVGQRIRLGTAQLDIVKPIDRCVMVTRPQPGGIERDLDVLRTINAERDSLLGIAGLVGAAGSVAIGDELIVD